ncbi:hypothetical protein CAI21_03875 [Alkalilimnicola ehrlichii]|uniref:DUF4124 domain-containing protein n=1 Tax=Alkalilimnicola ehrlichii TaxID=351052 RepID=A0A3E0X226_9GAMM|nr:DUF4124 domain-containing protein [Alkalilimnicola ehrlichii]RFA30664.1 hypothetical protein CAI21_03875 [Alkalilimnicola ehrlichii]RFA38243.1 hypothetical protein CAL65_05245 [Alkalilimnicola ehrlichii]
MSRRSSLSFLWGSPTWTTLYAHYGTKKLLCLAVVPLLVGTTVYTWTDEEGRTHFSDEPREGARQIEVEPAPSVPSLGRQPPEAEAVPWPEQPPNAFRGYDTFRIVSPAPEETLRDNLGQVSVSVVLDPPLQPEHTLYIEVNGEPWGEMPTTRSTRFTLSGLHRGAQTLRLSIVDQRGEVVDTASTTFYLHQASRLIQPSR